MKELQQTTRFRRDYKREKKTYPRLEALVRPVIEMLVNGVTLPVNLFDHALSGEWVGCRDCHIMPDLVLIYEVTDISVTLIRLGSHSELF